MSELRLETYSMPAADLGPENPLPALRGERELHALDEGSNVPQAMVDSLIWGQPANILPYTRQDGYDRERQPRAFRVAVLENEILRATFLLELGGRLWSLVHKPTGRELLSATRSSSRPTWRSATPGSAAGWSGTSASSATCPFTCSPLFAGRVRGPDGTPVLRMYEWERVRAGAVPDRRLPARRLARALRPRAHHQPARPGRADVLVVEHGRAGDARHAGAGAGRPSVSVRLRAGSASCPMPAGPAAWTSPIPPPRPDACDFFFRMPDGRGRWITALDGAGRGLVAGLHRPAAGRKLFVWGMSPGGRRWQEFLSGPGRPTSRSRPAWRARRWSTCPCRPGPNGRGWRPTA